MAPSATATDKRRARQTSRRSVARSRDAGGARKTILVALAANAVIAVTKLAGGLVSASSALLAEAAHSIADATNQAFLLVSLSLSAREPSERQPFGHGEERYLWTFMAAVGMFVAGAILRRRLRPAPVAHRARGSRRLRHRLGHAGDRL